MRKYKKQLNIRLDNELAYWLDLQIINNKKNVNLLRKEGIFNELLRLVKDKLGDLSEIEDSEDLCKKFLEALK